MDNLIRIFFSFSFALMVRLLNMMLQIMGQRVIDSHWTPVQSRQRLTKAHDNGGGMVNIPPGIYKIGSFS
jgi:hypothetical protein